MNPGLMKIGVWNVRGLYGKEKPLQEELKKSKCRYISDTRNKKEIKGFARVGRLFYCTVLSQRIKEQLQV